ncbi:hypothetical protein E0500_038495 [Streptomyces sp. KM273126]|uniref:hypothetical protein n=1 Tax=Streptomyces sp. KM273126 TaxID=2545247 RepID=UPI0010ECE26E|nr:hypothetical protein [Streptomyces sp. KM273126]MBA2813049.1 hypothetical protein [Streptomyces sp. KM273126]
MAEGRLSPNKNAPLSPSGEGPVYMGLYVDENGEELSDWEEGQLETLTELVNALGDYWNAGVLTLAAAVKVYAQTAELTEDASAEFLTGIWVDHMLDRMRYGG